jgi:hypothetical protein
LCFNGRFPNACYQAVFVTNLSGANMTELSIGEDPEWSPDGKKIAATGFVCDFLAAQSTGSCPRYPVLSNPARADRITNELCLRHTHARHRERHPIIVD